MEAEKERGHSGQVHWPGNCEDRIFKTGDWSVITNGETASGVQPERLKCHGGDWNWNFSVSIYICLNHLLKSELSRNISSSKD